MWHAHYLLMGTLNVTILPFLYYTNTDYTTHCMCMNNINIHTYVCNSCIIYNTYTYIMYVYVYWLCALCTACEWKYFIHTLCLMYTVCVCMGFLSGILILSNRLITVDFLYHNRSLIWIRQHSQSMQGFYGHSYMISLYVIRH